PACTGLAGALWFPWRGGGRPGFIWPLPGFGDPPALARRQRPGLHEPDAVADAAGVLAVMRLVLLRAADDLAVLGVLHPVLDHDHDGLVHLVADHVTLADLAVAPAGPGRRLALLVTHCLLSPRQWSRCQAHARASPCRCGRSP